MAVREQRGAGGSPVFESVSEILLSLPVDPNLPAMADPVATQTAADYLKSIYQHECRARCQGRAAALRPDLSEVSAVLV
ncbi:hypothetical protein [Pelomicrobium methylotrophicum]|uniref:Uncharacterized protein n=1 Tax=Pelomicrobium methylotrophicum TaxID=2602750 RepID=A0A5C7EK71_9PROT|nr:hypothetical protein [Pelomicrobium methylotrophicum]TXF11857.1 hypothetical protein FR698_08755 [Pelomicrobium methylotrophicum]